MNSKMNSSSSAYLKGLLGHESIAESGAESVVRIVELGKQLRVFLSGTDLKRS